MSRFLVVVPPVAERVRSAAALGRSLAARGHDVAWVGDHRVLDGVIAIGAPVVPVTDPGGDSLRAPGPPRPVGGVRSPADLVLRWNDYLLPLARLMLPAVHTAVDGFRPHVVVADQQAIAGPAVALLRGLPWATLVPTSAGLAGTAGTAGVAGPRSDRPDIARHVGRVKRRFLREVGLDEVTAARADPRTSPQLVVVFSTPALTGPLDDPSGRHVFVGPCLDVPPGGTASPHAASAGAGPAGDPFDRARPVVVVSLDGPGGQQRGRLYRAAAEALSPLPVRALVGPPLPTLAQKASALVCDGGHRTVCEALAGGVPLVVVPAAGDPQTVAAQVVRAGAGVRMSARYADAARLRMAVERVLTDVRVRLGAERVRDSFAAAAGPRAAAQRLEALVDVTSTPKLQSG